MLPNWLSVCVSLSASWTTCALNAAVYCFFCIFPPSFSYPRSLSEILGPLYALLCWVLPQTQSWARLWSSTFFACVFTQFIQVLALRLGSALLADSAVIGSNAVLLRLLLGVAVIVLTLKLPGLMRMHLDSGLGFVRYYAYRLGAQAVSGGAAKAGAMVGGARGRGGA